ncbi:MAG: ChbG/HpnK family deacetylase [Verrucomicrobiae bacterium]
MKAPVPLITRADDFGVSPGTNDAILACLDAGFVRNAGVMAPAPFLRHRFAELVERQGSFGPGLHATINSEWSGVRWGPVLARQEVPSLAGEDGTFYRSTQELDSKGALPEIVAEISAQLDLVRRLGLRPIYLDTHMVFTWIPGVADALATLCQNEGLIFANSAGFASLPLPFSQEVTPEALADALAGFESGHPGQRPVWVFHPAMRDEVSEQFFFDPAAPSSSVADSRHCEFAGLSDAARMSDLARKANARPSQYPRHSAWPIAPEN